MSKKTRGPNFSSGEKKVLIELTDKYKEIVGNKKADAVTIAAKKQAWEKLTEEFNTLSSYCIRTEDQLRTCWDNLRRTTRNEKALAKQESHLTRGNRNENPSDTLQAQIKSLLGSSLVEVDNVFDSDSHSIEENDTLYVEVLSETETKEDKKTDAGRSQVLKVKRILQSKNADNICRSRTPEATKTKVFNHRKRKNNSPSSSSSSSSSSPHKKRPRTSLQDKACDPGNRRQQAFVPRTPAMLSAGSKAKPAPRIPFHLPPLPDPHAYIRTPTHKQPVTEYEAIREKAAYQKKDIEKAITEFLAKTSETHNLFNTEDNPVFPLIACKPTFPAYLPCLLPTDQGFDFDELEYHFQVANRTEDMPADKKDQSDNEGDNGDDNDNANNSHSENQDTPSG
ncbi:unnamed protein product [Danaus chrysippus]|uniref:Regulatory protein zeste n=1 Tax=Danaus chrysippus TaxID=151541 RepID=A0A8J2R5Z9_9NEOP|nr:unnamed protein product [Danaus chrysippus]